jgi:8-oxo-dGTP diphosphatase
LVVFFLFYTLPAQFIVMSNRLNPHISVDCVIFGFDETNLKVLLIDRILEPGSIKNTDHKLPGSLILEDEDLDRAAYRVLRELTGLENIYLQQFSVFGSLKRMANHRDWSWLRQSTNLTIERVVTIAYYSLIKIDESRSELAKKHNARWVDAENLPKLAFDHEEIVNAARLELQKEIKHNPVVFELLPAKFTIRQLQTLYEIILGKKFDSRNFRKKLAKQTYIVPLDEKEEKVAHKPARLFEFDKKSYIKSREDNWLFDY